MNRAIPMLFLGCLNLMLHAQSYVPFPDTLTVWRQSKQAGMFPNTFYTREDVYTGQKVMIDSLIYTELRKTGYSQNVLPYYLNSYTDSIVGYFRNDTSAKKVLLRNKLTDSTDRTLYDFSLNVGDTIPDTWVGSGFGWNVVIDSIDTVTMLGQPRRRLHFWDLTSIPGYNGTIIEGVGSVHGIDWELGVPIEPAMAQLECFTYKDSSYEYFCEPMCFYAPVYSENVCWKYSSLNPYEQPKETITLSYTPSEEEFFLQTTNTVSFPATLQIFDVAGHLIYCEPVTENTTAVSKKGIATGVYLWQLLQGNSLLAKGKIVLH